MVESKERVLECASSYFISAVRVELSHTNPNTPFLNPKLLSHYIHSINHPSTKNITPCKHLLPILRIFLSTSITSVIHELLTPKLELLYRVNYPIPQHHELQILSLKIKGIDIQPHPKGCGNDQHFILVIENSRMA